jgi:hypothetical protein
MPLVLGQAFPRRLHFGQKVVHHVAHVLIIGDRQPRCQVMRGTDLNMRECKTR